MKLAAGKTAGMAFTAIVFAGLYVVVPLLTSGISPTADVLWPNHLDSSAWLLVFYAALGPGALASALQTYGQAKVPSAQTQVCQLIISLASF